MKNMPKHAVTALAAFAIVAFFQIQPATAQHWDGYGHGTHHHTDYGHFHGHYQGGHHYAHDSYHYQDSYHDHAPIALGYVDMPLNQFHSNNSVYCPDDVGCPLQYNQPAQGGLSQQNPPYQDAPYLAAPRQYEIPNGLADSVGSYDDQVHPNDGHDHGDHSHDGHSHGTVNPSPRNPAVTFGTPDRQPMTAPTLPDLNAVPELPRYETPRDRPAQPSSPPTNDGPIRMDGPPPSLTTLFSSSGKIG
ncbi:hypothetical protein [Rosistilla oblonga]|uniref:hypothetical protein n=1 Tax=Rosistilla oblonga TaxID=2527990 RepID=UPI003A9851DC